MRATHTTTQYVNLMLSTSVRIIEIAISMYTMDCTRFGVRKCN